MAIVSNRGISKSLILIVATQPPPSAGGNENSLPAGKVVDQLATPHLLRPRSVARLGGASGEAAPPPGQRDILGGRLFFPRPAPTPRSHPLWNLFLSPRALGKFGQRVMVRGAKTRWRGEGWEERTVSGR